VSFNQTICLLIAGALATFPLSVGCGNSPQSREGNYLKRGAVQLARKDYSRAILEFRNAARAMPNDAEPYFQLGVAYLGAGGGAEAVSALRRATELNPNHAGAQLRLAELMALSRNEDVLRDAITRLESILSVSPDNLAATGALALAESRIGRIDDAAKRLEAALRKFPASLHTAVELARLKLNRQDLAGAEAVLKAAAGSSPQSAGAAVALAELYLLIEQPGQAGSYFQRALQLDPQSGPALMGLAAAQVAGRRLSEAEETLRRVAALPQKEYRPQHALFLYRTGKPEAALAEFEKLAGSDPADRVARTRLVSAYFAGNQLTKAAGVLSAVLKENPQDTDALLQRAQLSLRSGKTTDAVADLRSVLHFTPNAAPAHLAMAAAYRLQGMTHNERQELDQAVHLDPALLSARLMLARSFLPQAPKSALQVLDDTPASQKQILAVTVERNWALLALGLAKDVRSALDAALGLGRIPELVLQDAVLRLTGKDYEGARASAGEVLKGNPEEVRAARVIADSYVAQKQLAKARESLAKIAAGRPGSAALQHLLGQWYMTTGELAAAREAFEAAKRANPKFFQAEFGLAEVDLRQGRVEPCKQRLAALVAADPKNVMALLKLAGLEEDSGNRPSAIARYRAVLDVDDANLFALNNLAYDLAVGSPDEALTLAQQAAEHAPDNPSVQDTLGWIYYRKGIYRTAIDHLKAAVDREPTPKRQFHLAISYLKYGDQDSGRRLLGKALQQDPTLPKTEHGW
jgi:tetratricopeptide (TPR) repeat protein